MALKVAGLSSLTRHFRKTEQDLASSTKALASGSKLEGGNDVASYAIAGTLKNQLNGLRVARDNAENALSVIQVAEGGLNEQNNILIRLRELAVQSASDTVGDVERQFLAKEADELIQEVTRIAEVTRFGARKLLSGEENKFQFQVGPGSGDENRIRVNIDVNTTANSLDIDGVRIDDQDDAYDALDVLDEAITKIGDARSTFGAIQSRLQSSINNVESQVDGVSNAYSKMADADIAKEVARFTKAKIQTHFQAALASQLNSVGSSFITLLQ